MTSEDALFVVILVLIGVNYRRGIWKIRTKELRKTVKESMAVIETYEKFHDWQAKNKVDDVLEADVIQ